MAVSLSMMPSANIMPALGPPMSPTLNFTVNGNWELHGDLDAHHRTRPPDSFVPTRTVWLPAIAPHVVRFNVVPAGYA